MILFISGLPGSGKSTIGKLVAEKLGWKFVEADKFLTSKMKHQVQKGDLLTSEQLDFWVADNLIPHITKIEKKLPLVVAGMLAEKKYVKRLSQDSSKIIYINLQASYEILKKRIISRNHFAKEKILDECWNIKEDFNLPGPTINTDRSVKEIVDDIISLF